MRPHSRYEYVKWLGLMVWAVSLGVGFALRFDTFNTTMGLVAVLVAITGSILVRRERRRS